MKKLILNNFQKHSNLEIDFSKDLNIIYGSSDVGKSSIRRALQWIYTNKNVDGLRKSGTKKTSVKVFLDNNVEVERIKSNTINRYVLSQDGKELQFDAVGKSIPNEIQDALKIKPIEIDGDKFFINFAPQLSLPFLFDKSPSYRMKLFNSLSGNDILDKLFIELNKDILRTKRDLKTEETNLENLSKSLEEKDLQKQKTETTYNHIKSRFDKIKENYSKYRNLKDLEEKLQINKKTSILLANKVKDIQVIDTKELKSKITQYDALNFVRNRLNSNDKALKKVRYDLDQIKLYTVDCGQLRHKIERFNTLNHIYTDLDVNNAKISKISNDLGNIKDSIGISENRQKELLNELKVCPLCKNELK